MARYIDADKLIETLREIQETHSPNLTKATNEAIDLGLSLAMRMARKEPTADVAEVVRCEKCKYGDVGIFEKTKNGQERWGVYCDVHKRIHNLDWYCPWGERKDDV